MEKLFKEWLAARGVEVEAKIFRAPAEWARDLYIFRFRAGGGDWSGPNEIAWDMATFARVTEIIEGQIA